MPAFIDLTGQRFGRLTVLSRGADRVPPNGRRITRWNCQCDCGTETLVAMNKLRRGHTQSCGCLHKEKLLQANFKHGKSKSPEFYAWDSMIQRCTNPNHQRFKDWGGRGITVCDEWQTDFMAFYNHVGPRPAPDLSIDRIDNNDGYRPGNVRWATRSQQQRNKRITADSSCET